MPCNLIWAMDLTGKERLRLLKRLGLGVLAALIQPIHDERLEQGAILGTLELHGLNPDLRGGDPAGKLTTELQVRLPDRPLAGQRVYAQRQQLFLAGPGIPIAPQLRTVGRHLNHEAMAVRHAAQLLAWLQGTDRSVGELHGTVSSCSAAVAAVDIAR